MTGKTRKMHFYTDPDTYIYKENDFSYDKSYCNRETMPMRVIFDASYHFGNLVIKNKEQYIKQIAQARFQCFGTQKSSRPLITGDFTDGRIDLMVFGTPLIYDIWLLGRFYHDDKCTSSENFNHMHVELNPIHCEFLSPINETQTEILKQVLLIKKPFIELNDDLQEMLKFEIL